MDDSNLEEIVTPIGIVQIHTDERYVHHICFSKKHDDLEEMKNYVETCNIFVSDYAPIASLMDIRSVKGSSQEVRDFMSQEPSIKESTIAVAFWVDSGISRTLGNIFLKFHQPPYPAKLFTDRDKAIDWLKYKTKEYDELQRGIKKWFDRG
ncbi:MAG: hypothetical protein MK212_01380 [Saprospiraceae bacterium]|nr:hypothetical protein [Saprospiraceae bacterium]